MKVTSCQNLLFAAEEDGIFGKDEESEHRLAPGWSLRYATRDIEEGMYGREPKKDAKWRWVIVDDDYETAITNIGFDVVVVRRNKIKAHIQAAKLLVELYEITSKISFDRGFQAGKSAQLRATHEILGINVIADAIRGSEF